MPARRAAPYPRCFTWTTRAPCDSAISIDPSVEPLSATITSPGKASLGERHANALSTQMPREFASFRQGMTTETSRPSAWNRQVSALVQDCVWPKLRSSWRSRSYRACQQSSTFPRPSIAGSERSELANDLEDQIGLAQPLLVGPALVLNHHRQSIHLVRQAARGRLLANKMREPQKRGQPRLNKHDASVLSKHAVHLRQVRSRSSGSDCRWCKPP